MPGDQPQSFEAVALAELGRALEPLNGLTSPERVARFARQLGWELPSPSLDPGLGAIASLPARIATLEQAGSAFELIKAISDLLTTIEQVFAAVEMLPERVEAAFASAQDFLENSGILDDYELPRRLTDYVLITYLARRHPTPHAIGVLLGVIEYDQRPADSTRYQPAFVFHRVHWDRLPALLQDPGTVLADVYEWGTPGFASDLLLDRIGLLLRALQVPGGLYNRDPDLVAVIDPGTGSPPAAGSKELRVPLYQGGDWPQSFVQLGVALMRATDPGEVRGLALLPYLFGSASVDFPIGEQWTLQLGTSMSLEGGVALMLMPGQGLKIRTGVIPGSGTPADLLEGQLRLALRRVAPTGGTGESEILLFGQSEGSRFTAAKLEVRATGEIDAGVGTLSLELDLAGAKIVISGADFDGFLAAVLPKDPLAITFDFGVLWSSRSGLRFSGGGGLEIRFPLQLSILGVLEVPAVELRVHVDGATRLIEASASADVGVNLGPVHAEVAGIGLRALLQPTLNGGGNLGVLDADLGFRPPDGAALSIDSGAVTGGGFLSFDPDKAQYAGGLYLKLESITLNAIGLLTTRLPDGSPGFSLLVIIQASGFTPIQLGWGFTLNGIGGLLGIHRTVDVDVLREGVRNRTLDAILFSPDDPTPRAPQIISTLQSVFPPAADQYVFGPMALFGWGAPVTLITIEVALILELPSPLRLILLGRVRAALPNADTPIVSIHCDVIGIIDFDQRQLSVDASLYDSMVGPYALSGDMAARASWGDNPDFAMALGGFHPAFTPPAGFPVLRRLALALSTGDNPRLRMETYFALTSNTVQVGARLELYVEVAGFSLEGKLGFDTLIQFDPFRVLADIYAHLALKRGRTTLMGLDVTVHLTGPAPWVLWGEASFKILWIKYTRSFRAKFGREEAVPPIERKEVWPLLSDSLSAPASWSAQLPEAGQLVTVRAEPSDDELLAHPFGTLVVSQGLVPLERTLELFGSVPPKDFDSFAIVGATGLRIPEELDRPTQHFAPAQFRRMSDAEKLASPSFERMVSGARLVPQEMNAYGPAIPAPLAYESSIIRDFEQAPEKITGPAYTPGVDKVAALAEQGPAGTAEVRKQGRKKFAPEERGPAVAEPKFVVAYTETLIDAKLEGLDGSYTSAAEKLRSHPRRHALQIVRAEELS